MRISCLTVLAALALTACAKTPPPLTPGPHLTVLPTSELPAPAEVDPGTGAYVYRIAPYDRLLISVFGIPELSQQDVQVSTGGTVSFPFIGEVVAQGRTPQELASDIAAGLRRNYMRDPQVTVNVKDTVSQMVTVDGQVREPGAYPAESRMTLMRAVARARGTTEFARLQDVVIFRTVGDQEMAALYNLDAIRRGAYRDPPVYANDVVIVGDSPARRMFRDILQASGLIVSPVVALLQRV